jgi:BirA family biotin operon repressor/biotin-[acetyl-CoA-carboxylase] ligase
MQLDGPIALEGPPVARAWKIHARPVVSSTQEVARDLPAWSAVVAEAQEAGRGQAQRSFVSDPGGLYLTAVVPLAAEPLRGRGFSLAAGWTVRTALLELGVAGVRLRWPNDLMIAARKVGGILVEQAGRDTLLVGLGLNVTNRPWLLDATLRGTTTSLQESWGGAPDRSRLVTAILHAIGVAHEEFGQVGLAGMVMRLNASWGPPRRVQMELHGASESVEGEFCGITTAGDVEIFVSDNRMVTIPAHRIARLREV